MVEIPSKRLGLC